MLAHARITEGNVMTTRGGPIRNIRDGDAFPFLRDLAASPSAIVSGMTKGEAARWLRQSHEEYGCSDGRPWWDCRCSCADHRCKDAHEPPAQTCDRCGPANGWIPVVEDGYAGKHRVPGQHYTYRPCPDCRPQDDVEQDTYARLNNGIRWDWWSRYTLAGLPAEGTIRTLLDPWIGLRRQHDTEHQAPAIVFLFGPPGSGKTHAAIGCAGEYVRNGRTVYYRMVGDLLQEIKDTFDRGRGDNNAIDPTAHVLNQAKLADLAILDDLGAEHVTDWSREQVFHLVNHRLMAGKATIVCHNPRLATLTDDRLVSRLSSGVMIDLIEEPDHRQKGA